MNVSESTLEHWHDVEAFAIKEAFRQERLTRARRVEIARIVLRVVGALTVAAWIGVALS